MNMRLWSSLLGLCVAIAAAAFPSPAAAQAPTRDGGQWVVPRTPDGHPDLQGNWTNQTLTPLQRGRNQESAVYTPREAPGTNKGPWAGSAGGNSPATRTAPARGAGGAAAAATNADCGLAHRWAGARGGAGSQLPCTTCSAGRGVPVR